MGWRQTGVSPESLFAPSLCWMVLALASEDASGLCLFVSIVYVSSRPFRASSSEIGGSWSSWAANESPILPLLSLFGWGSVGKSSANDVCFDTPILCTSDSLTECSRVRFGISALVTGSCTSFVSDRSGTSSGSGILATSSLEVPSIEQCVIIAHSTLTKFGVTLVSSFSIKIGSIGISALVTGSCTSGSGNLTTSSLDVPSIEPCVIIAHSKPTKASSGVKLVSSSFSIKIGSFGISGDACFAPESTSPRPFFVSDMSTLSNGPDWKSLVDTPTNTRLTASSESIFLLVAARPSASKNAHVASTSTPLMILDGRASILSPKAMDTQSIIFCMYPTFALWPWNDLDTSSSPLKRPFPNPVALATFVIMSCKKRNGGRLSSLFVIFGFTISGCNSARVLFSNVSGILVCAASNDAFNWASFFACSSVKRFTISPDSTACVFASKASCVAFSNAICKSFILFLSSMFFVIKSEIWWSVSLWWFTPVSSGCPSLSAWVSVVHASAIIRFASNFNRLYKVMKCFVIGGSHCVSPVVSLWK